MPWVLFLKIVFCVAQAGSKCSILPPQPSECRSQTVPLCPGVPWLLFDGTEHFTPSSKEGSWDNYYILSLMCDLRRGVRTGEAEKGHRNQDKVEEGKRKNVYDQSTLCTCMKMSLWNSSLN